jgi:tRNA1(Val) A37 N6-methylase TrmN6
MAEVTPDLETAFLGGLLRLRQPDEGHRAGTDAVLLAAAAPAEIDGLALDIGAGVGAAGLALAKLRPRLALGLVENDLFLATLARDNLSLNDLADRGRVHQADVLNPASWRAAGLVAGSAQLVITNPPFLDPGRARLSPNPNRRAAHSMSTAGPRPLAAWIAACMALLEDQGLFIMIHKPEALPEILAALSEHAGAITLLPVHPRADKPAMRILVRGRRGSRASFAIAPALVLHSGQGFGREAEAIHRGEALIDW